MNCRRTATLDELRGSADRARELRQVLCRAAWTVSGAVCATCGICSSRAAGDPVGYVLTAMIALAGGYSCLSIWREKRREERAAAFICGFDFAQVLQTHVQGGRRGQPTRPAPIPGTDAGRGRHGG